jgi:hypothetical protein
LTLLVGFVLGAALLLPWWPNPPAPGVPPPRSWDVRVTVVDAYLSRLADRRAATISVPTIRHVVISSSPAKLLVAGADVSVGPVGAPVTLELQPVAQSGEAQVRVISAHVGAIPIPVVFLGVIRDAINSSTRHLLSAGARITGVTVIPGGLEIYASYR